LSFVRFLSLQRFCIYKTMIGDFAHSWNSGSWLDDFVLILWYFDLDKTECFFEDEFDLNSAECFFGIELNKTD